MLGFLKDFDEFDALFFVPTEDNSNVFIETKRYLKKGKLIGATNIGPMWHIVLFKFDGSNVKHLDHFEGIFSDPREYVSSLIPSGWYGLIAKKTTTSNKFLQEALANFKSLM